jgi:hypothetical protein
MGRFSVIRTPAFDLLAGNYAREHPKLEADLAWLIGRLAEAPEQMGDHVPELGGMALPIFKTRCKDSCHRIGASTMRCTNRPQKCFYCFFTIIRSTKTLAQSFFSKKWNAHSHQLPMQSRSMMPNHNLPE